MTLSGKLIYRAVCDTKGAWNANLSRDLAKLWVKWESRLPESFTIQRSLVVHREEIEQIYLHSFGAACANGVAACVYAVIRQASGTNQGLIAARSRLAKQGLTIPRLELVALVTWLWTSLAIGPFIRGKIRRVLHRTRTFRINGTFHLK